MTNVIRPTFGRPPELRPTAPEDTARQPLRVYGDAAGQIVALMEDPDAPEGAVLKVVVGPLAGNSVEAVAILPRTEAGEIDAELVGMAVLRALALME